MALQGLAKQCACDWLRFGHIIDCRIIQRLVRFVPVYIKPRGRSLHSHYYTLRQELMPGLPRLEETPTPHPNERLMRCLSSGLGNVVHAMACDCYDHIAQLCGCAAYRLGNANEVPPLALRLFSN